MPPEALCLVGFGGSTSARIGVGPILGFFEHGYRNLFEKRFMNLNQKNFQPSMTQMKTRNEMKLVDGDANFFHQVWHRSLLIAVFATAKFLVGRQNQIFVPQLIPVVKIKNGQAIQQLPKRRRRSQDHW